MAETAEKRTRSTPAQQWVERFGGAESSRTTLRADLALARAVEEGLPTEAVDAATRGGILDHEVIYDLVVSKRTLQRRREGKKRLSPDESDRLARLVRLIARAETVLGDSEKVRAWLCRPNRALSGKTPMELLASEVGARAVERVLGRIEHGVIS